jgi:hypothetical protein
MTWTRHGDPTAITTATTGTAPRVRVMAAPFRRLQYDRHVKTHRGVVDMTHIRSGSGADGLPGSLRRQTVQRRRDAMDALRRLAVQLDAASALERRAGETANPALASVLRERAAERRRIAEVVREHLADEQSSAAPVGAAPHLSLCDTQPIPVVPTS